MNRIKTGLAVLLSVSLVCGAVGAPGTTYTRQVRTEAAEAAAEPGVSFSNTYLKPGVPMNAVLTGISAADVSYSWTVGGAKVSGSGSSYTPTEEDYEKMITVTVTADGKEYSCSAYFSTLPVVYINTDGGAEIESKTEYIGASLTIQGNSEFSASSQLYSGAIQIRGRGNYTWEHSKKPYKIKLDSKSDIFGLGSSKHWVLLAEYLDYTHIRNEVMPELSEELDMEYTANFEAVAVVLNGEYNGLYHLGENVRIADNRVNIYDWEETAEDIAKAVYKAEKSTGMTKDDRDRLEDQLTEDLSWVTSGTFTWDGKTYKVSDHVQLPDGIDGGYLLELDTYDDYHVKQVSDFDTDGDQPIQFKSPEYAVTNPEMYNYAKDYIQSFENAVSADDFYASYSGTDKHYSELFDMDSLVKYWLILELSSNCDGMRYSNYMYKDFGGLFKMGPAWDYDWTWNASYIVPTNEWWTDQCYYNNTAHWYKYLAKDPYFITQAYELYNAHRSAFSWVCADGGSIDRYSSELELASKADLAKWHSSHDYATEIGTTKEYVTKRFKWLDEQFSSVEGLAQSLGYEASDKLSVSDVSESDGRVKITAAVNDSSAAYVTFHINGINAGEAEVSGGRAVIEVSADMLSPDDSALNTVQIRMKDSSGEYLAAEDEQKQNDPWGRGSWNPWEEPDVEVGSLVYSNFTVFSADEIGISTSVMGDVNLDSVFNIADLVAMQQWILDSPTNDMKRWQNGDLNGDGIINSFDTALMRRALLNV